jgi:hypothetical protein
MRTGIGRSEYVEIGDALALSSILMEPLTARWPDKVCLQQA